MDWSALFDRAAAFDVTEADVRESLAVRRAGADEDGDHASPDRHEPDPEGPADPSPVRVVADADVLAADLLVGGPSREALDALRRHSWMQLVASDRLLTDAEAVVTDLADAALAAEWRERVERWRDPVVHPAADHPALGSAYRGGAMHVLSFDGRLTSAAAGTALAERVPVSVREPRAFAAVFDAARLYPEVADAGADAYPGPDRDPRT